LAWRPGGSDKAKPQIERLREIIREHHMTIDRLDAEVVRLNAEVARLTTENIKLRRIVGVLLRRLGFKVSELPSDEEIAERTSA
jgi:hypothetical protein